METGGLAGAVFNAAKETALDGFIAGKIGFLEMDGVVEAVLSKLAGQMPLGNAALSLDMVLETDREARRVAQAVISAQ